MSRWISCRKSPKVAFDPNAKPLVIPTVAGSFDKLQEQLAEIVDKIDKIPFDSIGKNLDQTLAGLNATIKQVNGQTLPEFKTPEGVQKTMGTANDALSGDSPLQQNLGSTLQELQRMARSLRVLTDYLGGHPEALIRGRSPDARRPPRPPRRPPPNRRQGASHDSYRPGRVVAGVGAALIWRPAPRRRCITTR
jgi:paraquat-inducible protein B